MNQVTIVTYHFVRELKYTKYPKIKGLLASYFKEQLAYMKKHYEFISVEECISAIDLERDELPSNAILLTFDDGYIDHYTTVFPLLEESDIQGCFFPPAKAILKHEVLDVNKIHFLLASVPNINVLLKDVYNCLDKYRPEFSLNSNAYYFSKLAQESRFDPKEVIFIKRLLQMELQEEIRHLIVDELFGKYVTDDQVAFSKELYMTVDQLRCMSRNGMYIGSHGYEHNWLNTLPPDEQEKEIDLSLEFLHEVKAPTDNWIMCYPYGGYNSSLIDIIKKKRCKFALTVEVDIARLDANNAFTLERLDTNDLPKTANAEPNFWTKNKSIVKP